MALKYRYPFLKRFYTNTLYVWLIVFAACNQGSKTSKSNYQEGLQVESLGKAGLNPEIINKIDTAVTNGTFPNIHSLLIAQKNQFVYEKYWTGKDEKWALDIGITKHDKDSLHDIRSITKSIVSACFGILMQQGKIKSIQQKIFDFFPEYAKQDTGMKSQITIEHLLTMNSGLKWNEEIPYSDPENSEVKMIQSGKPVEFVFNQPMEIEPGKQWKYNGGTTQLLAAIIERTSGLKIDEFANKNLFTPLGIKQFEWVRYPGTSELAAASGLRLRSRDLLKFGLLYMNKGIWEGRQIVPSEWIETSTREHIQIEKNKVGYGYQFWLFNDSLMNHTVHIVACVGNGDQRILMNKDKNLVVVATAGNYNQWNIKNNIAELVRNFVYPALK